MRKTALPVVAALVIAASLLGCGGLEDATENPPPRGETFPGVVASPAPVASGT